MVEMVMDGMYRERIRCSSGFEYVVVHFKNCDFGAFVSQGFVFGEGPWIVDGCPVTYSVQGVRKHSLEELRRAKRLDTGQERFLNMREIKKEMKEWNEQWLEKRTREREEAKRFDEELKESGHRFLLALVRGEIRPLKPSLEGEIK